MGAATAAGEGRVGFKHPRLLTGASRLWFPALCVSLSIRKGVIDESIGDLGCYWLLFVVGFQ